MRLMQLAIVQREVENRMAFLLKQVENLNLQTKMEFERRYQII